MEITEFLKHRISEDEYSWTTWLEGRPDVRYLAQCQAHRRIVRLLSECERGGSDSGEVYLRDVAAWLALSYSDHPDYDEGWRP